MKLWIDDIRQAPKGYEWVKSVDDAKAAIIETESRNDLGMYGIACSITLLDIDHDAGDYVSKGGDYIKLLDWLEETGRSYPIHIHSMNPVVVANMRTIIERNGWTEV